jgi:hypothetical protein
MVPLSGINLHDGWIQSRRGLSFPAEDPGPPPRYYQIVTNQDHAVPTELLQSFAGTTTAGPDSSDILAARETAIPWLREAGLIPADALVSGNEHAALLRLRDAVRDALAAHAAGGSGDDADLAVRLTRALSDGRLVVTIEPTGAVKLATAARSVYPSIVAALAVAIAEADAAGDWLKLT